ncbi:putative transcription factor Hap3/NF-YB family [Rosa chinensis]|uniref:Putative transcription factor Hap3/NF-YB family n=1 Tax=Rosa chinensis TaxID=74649 RepID=A0A2P6R739_ROSCH|nr:nuclear transcription factor Y subunit B-4 [Rosa chinensis]PRQ42219.1 putative transcription factor Hap3/NF-YB family [Rosa chinensis]
MVDHEEEQDRLLPIANVGRIMKQILPQRAKVSKEAKQRMQECATEFLSFVTGEASDKCHKENRKTVNGDDICWALSALGFDNYAEATTRYLHKFREAERERLAANQSNVNINTSSSSPLEIREEDQPIYLSGTQTPNLEFRILEKGDNSFAKQS